MGTMEPNSKMDQLLKLDEKALRESVLVPLLTRMGFKAVTIYHGPRERGKDIICFDFDRLGNREYFAVVAKVTDLDGSVSTSNNLREAVYQVEQCFDIPYQDLFGMTRVVIDRVWIITSGRIKSGAEESVYSHLEKQNLSRVVRFIARQQLLQLIDEHYPEYWNLSLEPIHVVREQKSRLIRFCSQILQRLGGSQSDIEITMNQVINSYYPPSVPSAPDKTLTRLGPYSVEIDSITPVYAHDFFVPGYGSIRSRFFKAKKALYYAMFDVDEIMSHYEEVIKQTDPKEFLSAFEEKLSEDYPFWKAWTGSAHDARRELEYLDEALRDLDELQDNLRTMGRLEWATSLVDSVGALEPEIASFLNHVDNETFSLCWRIEEDNGQARLRLLYEPDNSAPQHTFMTEHKKQVEFQVFQERRTRSITVEEILSSAHKKIREFIDGVLASERPSSGTDAFEGGDERGQKDVGSDRKE
jgi:hypothetical protein